MANRAYIVLRRSDLPDNFLEVLDLQPNTSQRRFPYETYGQTLYLSQFLLDGVNLAVQLLGAGPITFDGDNYGLSTYLVDNIENSGTVNDPPLTAAEATQIAGLIEADAAAGTILDAATIDAHINTPAGVTGAGLAVGNSSGSVEDILRILSGERYKVDAGATVGDATPTFVPGRRGYFTTGIGRLADVPGPGGRKSTDPVFIVPPATQGPTEDLNHIYVRRLYNTGDLHRSALLGVLAQLKGPTFTFLNPSESYGTGGSAIDLSGTAIPADGVFAAVQIYADDGTII
jgi:hypothetical protein